MEEDIAFSNPIYGQVLDDNVVKTNQISKPIPKPRLSKKKSVKSRQHQEKQDQAHEEQSQNQSVDKTNSEIKDNSEISDQNIDEPSSIPSKSSANFHDDNKRSSSLCLGDIRMTQLLEEINSLTDSLQKNFSSAPDNVDGSEEQVQESSANREDVPRRTFKRKRVRVKSDLFKMIFDEENEEKVPLSPNDETVPKETKTMSSGDSGVFLMASQKSVFEDDPSKTQKKEEEKHRTNEKEQDDSKSYKQEAMEQDGEPPKLPPRKPLRFDVVPKIDPIITTQEELNIEHLHNDTLSLQRSGYLWKTGPNYKCFKNRWCVLYRHSQNYFDANVSYYFNRSSMSASLSGKILLAEIEFIAVTDTIPNKTRLPKIEKVVGQSSLKGSPSDTTISNDSGDGSNQSLCFFEIGVKSRQGRIYLFAARSDTDRQQWIHAFVQAITLHAFKNKEIYHCGFIRAKFTITAKWQTCFAILTTDRFLYVFELEQDSPYSTLDCKTYHVFNLRKTIRVSRIDENSMTSIEEISNSSSGKRRNSDSIKESYACKFGFCLTQNGGHGVYLISTFETHTNLWYRSVWRFWLTPRQPQEKLILEEQYLNNDDIPVAFDKCIKFLDTFNQTGHNLFGPMQDSVHETVVSKEFSDRQTSDVRRLRVPYLPSHPSRQIQSSTTPGEMDLLTQQNLLIQLRFDSWNVHLLPQKFNASQISQLLLHYLRSMNECIFTEALLPYWIKLSSFISKASEECNNNSGSKNSNSNDDSNNLKNIKNEQMKRLLKLMPPVNYSTLRRFIIYLSNTTNKNEEYSLSTSLCKTMFFSKQNKSPVSVSVSRLLLISLIQNHVWLFDITKEELEKELHIKRVVNLIISQNRKENAKKQPHHQRMKIIRSQTADPSVLNSKPDRQKVHSLILGIKVIVSNDQKQNVNVHINRTTTANEVFEMILEKVKLDENEEMLSRYSVFEVLCNRRLERIILGKEKILPLVLCWSNWPSLWSMDACIEIKPTECLLKGQIKKVKLPNLNVIRFESELLNYTPTMLMSVIRYCGQNDSRLVKHILAEFSSSQLFLYCKETHHLLGQYGLEDIYWYVGIETGNIVQLPNIRCKSIVNDDDEDDPTTGVILSTGSTKSNDSKRKQQQQQISSGNIGSDGPSVGSQHQDYDVPAITFIERHRIKSRQSQERRNFGQTLVFNSWSELDQWIKGLLEASFHKELFEI